MSVVELTEMLKDIKQNLESNQTFSSEMQYWLTLLSRVKHKIAVR